MMQEIKDFVEMMGRKLEVSRATEALLPPSEGNEKAIRIIHEILLSPKYQALKALTEDRLDAEDIMEKLYPIGAYFKGEVPPCKGFVLEREEIAASDGFIRPAVWVRRATAEVEEPKKTKKQTLLEAFDKFDCGHHTPSMRDYFEFLSEYLEGLDK